MLALEVRAEVVEAKPPLALSFAAPNETIVVLRPQMLAPGMSVKIVNGAEAFTLSTAFKCAFKWSCMTKSMLPGHVLSFLTIFELII
jgi:hypothetical protein